MSEYELLPIPLVDRDNQAFFKTFSEIVIWGLRLRPHTHRHIHRGFYDNLTALKLNTRWVEDAPGVSLKRNSLVFCVDVASRHLPFEPSSTYVAHNLDLKDRFGRSPDQSLSLQVFTNSSTGTPDDHGSVAKYELNSRTLFQPWGAPTLTIVRRKTCRAHQPLVEHFVGSVWDNELGQGNMAQIDLYERELAEFGVRLKRHGRRFLSPFGVSEQSNRRLVSESRLGATVVGNWQRDNAYLPCRLFKAVSWGLPPTGNARIGLPFPRSAIERPKIESLVHDAINECESSRMERHRTATDELVNYTYQTALNRIARALRDRW